jgi:hypothetical protein
VGGGGWVAGLTENKPSSWGLAELGKMLASILLLFIFASIILKMEEDHNL